MVVALDLTMPQRVHTYLTTAFDGIHW